MKKEFAIKQSWLGGGSTFREKRFAKSSFDENERNKVVKRQNWHSYFMPDRLIQNYHHEPAKRILIARGVGRVNLAKYCLGLSLVEHAAIHSLAYRLYDDRGDWDASESIANNLTPEEFELFCEIISGNLKPTVGERMIEEIVARREKFLAGKA